MTLDELLNKANEFEPTQADMDAMQIRMDAASKQQEKEARAKQMTNEQLNQEFVL